MFGMGTYFKAAALGSGGAWKRVEARKMAPPFTFFLMRGVRAANWEQDWCRLWGVVSMETLNKIENPPRKGPAETLVPLKSMVFLTQFARFFPTAVSQCLTNKIKTRVF